jgi:hypothetical protein
VSERHGPEQRPQAAAGARYGRYVGLLALVLVVLITVNTLVSKHVSSRGVEPGQPLPPFAAPLATGTLSGDVNFATRSHQGAAGNTPACAVRGPQILNVCQLYERGPVVVALFVNGGECPRALDTLTQVLPSYPGVQVAAVALGGDRGALRRLIASHRWPFPVGYARDGRDLVTVYRVPLCPQLTFAYPGGIVQGRAIVGNPTAAELRERLALLVTQSRARGWRPPP